MAMNVDEYLINIDQDALSEKELQELSKAAMELCSMEMTAAE